MGNSQIVSWERVGPDMQWLSAMFLTPGLCSSSIWEAEKFWSQMFLLLLRHYLCHLDNLSLESLGLQSAYLEEIIATS